ncbi:MAG TPA: tetratricopeptide repeat protein [Phycisphaerae bacterium]|nr:tetratricopeptide repeat protein [Phycisphaerae bacterium]
MRSPDHLEIFMLTSRTTKLSAILAVAASLALLTGCESSLEKYRKLGIKQYNKGDYDSSLNTLNKALSYDQFDAQSNAYAGLIQYRQGNYEQAVYHFKVALQSDPSSEEAKDGLTAALIKLDKPDVALDYLERSSALADKVNDPHIAQSASKIPLQLQTEQRLYNGKVADRIRIARAYEKLGDYDNALVYYKKALALNDTNTKTLMDLAALSEKTGNKAATREYLIRAYNIDPATPGLTDAMTRNGVAISDVIGPGQKQPAAQ